MNRLAFIFCAYATLGLLACQDSIEHFEDDGTEGTNTSDSNPLGVAECDGVLWRNPSPGRVLCPGATDCGCDLPTICCADTLDNATCMPREECANDVIGCDGPEDCAQGEVCCASGIESSCVPASACQLDRLVLCRSDDDCSLPRNTCLPGEPPAIAACQ